MEIGTASAALSSDWADITPVLQDDGPAPVAAIQYAPEYTNLMNIFRAVLLSKEKSVRVINLTTELLGMNAGNYTVWQYRRECLAVLPDCLSIEISFLNGFTEDNPKNYQIWYHRRAIVTMTGSPDREKDFCDRVFRADAKNYHAWAHRQWVVKTFNLWDDELAVTDKMLTEDVRNNSAWNYRWFLVHAPCTNVSEELVRSEIDYAWAAIEKAELNESAWNYVRGYVTKYPFIGPLVKEKIIALEQRGRDIQTSDSEESTVTRVPWSNVCGLDLLADLLLAEGTAASFEEAAGHFEALSKHDTVRRKSWLRKKHAAELSAAACV